MPSIPTVVLSPDVVQWASILISIALALAFREWATSILRGLKFWFNKDFHHGEKVYLNDEPAVIISKGIRQTIFQTKNEDEFLWRYIPNEKIANLKLEKVIFCDENMSDEKEK